MSHNNFILKYKRRLEYNRMLFSPAIMLFDMRDKLVFKLMPIPFNDLFFSPTQRIAAKYCPLGNTMHKISLIDSFAKSHPFDKKL